MDEYKNPEARIVLKFLLVQIISLLRNSLKKNENRSSSYSIALVREKRDDFSCKITKGFPGINSSEYFVTLSLNGIKWVKYVTSGNMF